MLPKMVENKIIRLAQREGYVSFKIDIEEISKNGSNYLGDLYEVNVKGKDFDNDREANIFVKKIIIRDNEIAKSIAIELAYQNELFAYKNLFKMYDELQEEFKIPLEERYKTAKCFDESNEKILFLENLKRKGFKTYGKMDEVSFKFVELSIRQLAKFHALSFALQIIRPTYWETINVADIKPTTIWVWDGSKNILMELLMRLTAEHIENEEVKRKIEKFIPIALEKSQQYFDKNRSEIVCICHGDFKPVNVMVKESNGEETEVLPVDYQAMYCGCPINDFLYCIFSMGVVHHITTDYINMNNFKDIYFNALVQFSNHFNVDIEKIMPRAKFEKIVEERLDYGLIVATLSVPLGFAQQINIGEFARENEDVKIQADGRSKIKRYNKFLDCYMSVVGKFIEWGYL